MTPFDRIEMPCNEEKFKLADAETAQQRLSVCKLCDEYKDERCRLCNCLMTKKAWFQKAKCGGGKWEN